MKSGIWAMFARKESWMSCARSGPPVTVVRGNCDSNIEWPLIVDLVRGGLRFRLQHIPPERPPENVDVVLHGHTHVPRNEKRGNVLFLNPGCVTRPKPRPSVAWLELEETVPGWKSSAEGKVD